MPWPGVVAACALGLVAAAGAARAEFALCNAGEVPMRLAVASSSEWDGLTVRGQGDVAPGQCATADFSPALQPEYFYRLDLPAFTGADAQFCVEDSAEFFRENPQTCDGAGHMAGFRRLVPPPGATLWVVNLDASGAPLPPPELAMVDLSQPFAPPEPAAVAAPPVAGETAGRVVAGGVAPGSLGESYSFAGVWEGCEAGSEAACTFFADGWKFRAALADGTPKALLDRLRAVARGTEVSVTADLLRQQPERADLALSQVVVAEASPFLGVFWALQGRWQALDQGESDLDIDGWLATGAPGGEAGGGAEGGRAYYRLQLGCAEEDGAPAGEAAPAMVLFSIPDYQRRCAVIESLSDDELTLLGEDGDPRLRFRRP